jgi:TonB family protein
MTAADADGETKSFDRTEWLVPGTISLLAHVGLLAFLALHTGGKSGLDVIKAEALDISDSNSLKSISELTSKSGETREVSNQEMLERLSLPMGLPRNLKCSVAVVVAGDGRVLEAVVTRSTGSPNFDRSVVEAVYKASPFPRPSMDQLVAGIYRFELRLGEQ